jgi:DNA-3-methyladenine glycosylase II
MRKSFRITPRGSFSLGASTRFLEGFTPASYSGGSDPNHLHLAFPVEGSWETAGVCVRQSAGGIVGDVFGAAKADTVRSQVARILSLDIDGRGFEAIGEDDPVVASLLRKYPGLRPVLFWSPYEAAAWAIIGQRIRMVQAARIKQQLAERLGTVVDIHGQVVHAFPSPQLLRALEGVPGLTASKLERLREIGRASLDGRLDAGMLRSRPAQDAIDALQQLPGIGGFSAELIVVRGAGHPDVFPRFERRLHGAMAESYGLGKEPSLERMEAIAEKWRPFRSWVGLLFRTDIEDRTGEIT